MGEQPPFSLPAGTDPPRRRPPRRRARATTLDSEPKRWVVIFGAPWNGPISMPGGPAGYVIEHDDEKEAVLEAAHRLIRDTVENADPGPGGHNLLARYLAAGAHSAVLRP